LPSSPPCVFTGSVADELPKTSTGKIQKNVVRDRYAGHY
jgi:acyl-coenzyme A synthetase/AMP-(fatty) acid ligase